MQKNNDPVISGIRSSRVRMKKLLSAFKNSSVLRAKESSWELFGKLQQGISLIEQALILSEGEDGANALLAKETAKPHKSYYKPKKKQADNPAVTPVKK